VAPAFVQPPPLPPPADVIQKTLELFPLLLAKGVPQPVAGDPAPPAPITTEYV
jgi:hypothetical protein